MYIFSHFFIWISRSRYLITTLNVIDFMQLLTQRLWVKNSSFLQLPYFTASEVKHATTGKKGALSLRDYIQQSPADRKGLNKFSDDQRADIDKVLSILPNMEMSVKAYVEDEDSIYGGDIVTIEVTLTRLNVPEGENASPVYAPYFPSIKEESWWVIVTNPREPNLIAQPNCIKKITDLGRTVVLTSIKVVVPKEAGTYTYNVLAKSADYVGLDVQETVSMVVKPESEAPKFVPHEEDVALDKEPTLYQQIYGLKEGEESDSDSDDELPAKEGGSHGHSHGGARK